MLIADILQHARHALLGLAAYAMLHHLWMAWWHRDERGWHSWAAMFSLLVGVFAATRVAHHAAVGDEAIRTAVKLEYTALFLLIPAAIGFLSAMRREPPGLWTRIALAAGVLAAITPWLGELFVREELIPVREAYGYGAPTLAPGVLGQLVFVMVGATVSLAVLGAMREPRGYLAHAAVRRLARGSVALLVVAVVNDTCVVRGYLPSIRLIELAMALVLLGLSAIIAWRAALAARSLEGAVHERTAELETSKRDLERALDGVRDLIDGIPDSVLVCVGEDIRLVNRAAERYFGVGRARLVGGSIQELVDPGDRALMTRVLDGDAGGAAAAVEIHFRVASGELVGEMACLPLAFEGDVATLAIVRDVTERRRLQQQLLLADRLASVGTLAAGVAHEINNPLAYVMGNIHAMREELEHAADDGVDVDRTELMAMLEEAEDGAERVRRIVSDMRTFARNDDKARAAVDVNRVVQLAVNLTANSIKHRASLSIELEDVPTVLGDDGRLAQVFVNLLVNAVQAIEEGEGRGRIVVSSGLDGRGRVVVEIRDNGHGIDPAVAARIFDPFYTTKPVGVGSGLGLSICHGIVTALGGTIALEPADGGGTVARVTLEPSAEPVAPRPRRPATDRPNAGYDVLVIDDDRLVASSFQRLLKGHAVTVMETPEAGLEACLRGDYQVVLCDLMMPGMSGMELFERVSAERPGFEARFVFVTGGAFTERAQSFLATVRNPRLDKPVQPARLREVVREIAERHRAAA